jgi:hypothetical protein
MQIMFEIRSCLLVGSVHEKVILHAYKNELLEIAKKVEIDDVYNMAESTLTKWLRDCHVLPVDI